MSSAQFLPLDAARRMGAAWPDPDMTVVDAGRRPPPPLPLRLFAPWDSWIANTAAIAGAPPDYVAGSFLAAFATLVGSARVCLPWQGWREPSVLWFGLVGDPSTGKSPAADCVLDCLREVEKDLGGGFDDTRRRWMADAELAKVLRDQWESEVADAAKRGVPPPSLPANAEVPLEPRRPRILVSDSSVEALARLLAANPKGLLCHRDELAGLLGAFDKYGGSGSDRAFWIEAYGARPYVVDRVKYPEPIRIERVAVSILGAIQPDRLSSVLFNGDDDGLASRFLWLWPTPEPPRRPTRVPDRVTLLIAMRRLASLTLGPEGPETLGLAEDAASVFQDWRVVHFRDHVGGLLASAWGKLPGAVLRLAMILRLVRWAAGEDRAPVDVDHAATIAAIAFVEEYLKPMARRVYGDAALPAANRGAATLARWIAHERLTTMNLRDLRRTVRLPGLRTAAEIEAAVEVLVEAAWLAHAGERAGNTSGRERADFAVNPKVDAA